MIGFNCDFNNYGDSSSVYNFNSGGISSFADFTPIRFPVFNFRMPKFNYFQPRAKYAAKYNGKDDAFEAALKFSLKAEGGYSNNPYDKGGATNLGVTQKVYNAYRKENNLAQQDVTKITMGEAKQIYYNKYWIPSGAAELAKTDKKKAIALFDTSVLHGVKGAKDIYAKSDGSLNSFLDSRERKYSGIVNRDPSQGIFFKGWNNRVSNLQDYLGVDENKTYT